MATLAEIYGLRWGSEGVDLKARMKAAMLKMAADILNEDPKTEYHNTRVAWAKRTFVSPDAAAELAFSHLILNPTVLEAAKNNPANVPDSDIEFVVASVLPILVDQS